MEKQNNKLNKIIIVIIYIYFLAGVLWHILPQTRTIVINLTPYGLAFFSLVILFFNAGKISHKTFYWILSIFVITIIVEGIGVNTSLIFGNYFYSNILGFKLFGVPLVIGLNWTIVLLGLFTLTDNSFKGNIFLNSFMIGILAVLFDYILEPVAIKLNYWHWDANVVPLKNYISWFIISFVFGFIGFKLKSKYKNGLLIHYIFAQFLFLTMLNLLL